MMDNKGLSLIETAIIMLLVGLLLIPMLKLASLEYKKREVFRTGQALQMVSSALRKYVIREGRYPFPAQRNIPMGVAGAGDEVLGAFPNCVIDAPTACRINGAGLNAGSAALVGDVPYVELGLPSSFIVDGYGRKISYVVTESLTNVASFVDSGGVIDVVVGVGGPAANEDITNAHYVIYSAGEDGVGAFTRAGVLYQPCAGAIGRDALFNCDNTNLLFTNNRNFMPIWNAATGVQEIIVSRIQNDAATAAHFDDYIYSTSTTASGIWTLASGAQDLGQSTSGSVQMGEDIFSPPGVNPPLSLIVPDNGAAPTDPGVGNNIGFTKVHVLGDVTAAQINVPNICDNWGSDGPNNANNCATPGPVGSLVGDVPLPNVFNPSIIGGVPDELNEGLPGGGIACGGNSLTGISSSDEECDFNQYTGPLPTSCPPGTWPNGVGALGEFVCITP